jgi:hypothetical protein
MVEPLWSVFVKPVWDAIKLALGAARKEADDLGYEQTINKAISEMLSSPHPNMDRIAATILIADLAKYVSPELVTAKDMYEKLRAHEEEKKKKLGPKKRQGVAKKKKAAAKRRRPAKKKAPATKKVAKKKTAKKK